MRARPSRPSWWSCAPLRCRASSGSARAARRPTTAKPRPPWRWSCRCCWARCRPRRSTWAAAPARHGTRSARSAPPSTAWSAATGRRSAPSTSPCTTWRARPWACPSTGCWGCRPTSRQPTSRWASTSRRWSPSVRRRSARFPALKIKVGGAARPRHARGGAGGLRRSDPGRRQHRLDARGCRGDRAGARPAGRRADRAAIPTAALRAGSATCRRSRRSRSSPTSRPSRSRTSTRSSGSWTAST